MDYNLRIGENYLKGVWKDGEILQHTDLNEREVLIKAAINANYADIQKILDGTYVVGSAAGVAGATLSKLADEGLPSDDDKIPSALQVKDYVNNAKQEAIDSIPDDVSAFNNDAEYIDKTVDNLENYYLKSLTYSQNEVQAYVRAVDDLNNYYLKNDTYTKTEVQNLINSITKVTIQKVDRLPVTGQPNVIYFVPKAHTETSNIYDEFIWIDNDWENIGDTELDNLDLDIIKTGNVTTVTITKRNGTQESEEIYDGVSPDLQVGTVSSLPEGSQPTITKTGTQAQPLFNFGIPKGDTGATGNGIVSVVKTATSGLVDTYTITYSNGTTTTYDITNGQDGYSPTATVTQDVETQRTTIEITDKNGTTSAEIDVSSLNDYDLILTNSNRNTAKTLSKLNELWENYKNGKTAKICFRDNYTNDASENIILELPLYFKNYVNANIWALNSASILDTLTTNGEYGHRLFALNIQLRIVNNQITGYTYWYNNSYYVGTSSGTNKTILTTRNTTVYTPSGDYNPATKKYVDDKVGAINTVLATLTTPTSNGGN